MAKKARKHVAGTDSPTQFDPPVNPIGSWFYGSTTDLLIGCAALSAPLLILGYLFSSNYPNASSIAFYALALVFNYPHYMATMYRAYRRPADFNKYRIFTLHLTLLVGLLLILSHVSYQLLAFVFTLYLTWSPFHYSGQNFGIALMFARRNGVTTTRKTRAMFYLAFLTSYLMFFLTIHSSPTGDALILSLAIPLKVARVLWVGVLATFLISVLYSVSEFVKQTNWKKMTAPLILLSTQVFWFVIPTAFTLFGNVDFVRARSTAGLLAILHAAQYLWITSYYARREALAEGEVDGTGNAKTWRPIVYFAILMAGGIALFIPGPWFVSRLLRQDFTTSFLAFTALVNLHHFLLDGAIWKLRDGRIASLLLGSSRVDPNDGPRSAFGGLTSWLTGKTSSARSLRIAAVVILITLASFDQAKFYYGAQASDVTSLRRAQQLNPYDSSLLVKLARANDREGNVYEGRTAAALAVRINPNYRPAQIALGKFLVESSEYQQAYSHYQQMFLRVQPDSESLTNFGLLAAQLGKDDEAINSWQKAIDLDPMQPGPRLFIAEALIRKRQFSDAIPHYRSYLSLVASEASNSMPLTPLTQPDVVLNAILKLAAAYQNTGSNKDAEDFFTQAATLAERNGDREVLVFGVVHAAELKTGAGRLREAMSDYQRALNIENSVSDLARATDWVRYAQLLRRVNMPVESVLACFLKAEVILNQKRNSAEEEIPDLKAIVEKEIATAESTDANLVKSVRANLSEAVALALRARH